MNLIKRIRPFGGIEGTADAEHIMRTWYCSYRIVRSRHMVMALNEETLLPVVAPLTSMTKTAGPTLQRLVHAGLHSFGIPSEIIVRECAAMSAWSVEKRINRSMTGWMNDIWRSVVQFSRTNRERHFHRRTYRTLDPRLVTGPPRSQQVCNHSVCRMV
jgi:hypothetical protein